jgi:hypothetical protein
LGIKRLIQPKPIMYFHHIFWSSSFLVGTEDSLEVSGGEGAEQVAARPRAFMATGTKHLWIDITGQIYHHSHVRV